MWVLVFIFMFLVGYHAIDVWAEVSESEEELSGDHLFRKDGEILESSYTVAPSPVLDEDDRRIRELIEQGYVSRAVKLYGEKHGLGMMEAMEEIEKLQAELEEKASPAVEEPEEKQEVSIECDREDAGSLELEEVRVLLEQGKKIEAIKRFRELTGAGLRDAKVEVERMGSESSSFEFSSHSVSVTAGEGSVETTTVIESPEVFELLKAGKKIQAIKLVREHLGCGLKEAKEMVDAMQASM